MSVAYYYLIRPYAVGVPNNNTNLYVNSAFSIANYHAQLFDNLVIAGRLAGMLILGYLSDFSFHNSSLNVEQYSTYFALYHSLWLFFLFVVIILALRHSLLVNLSIFAGMIYNFSPAAGFYFYPWDVPATLFFTLGILFYERRQILQMILVMCVGCIFKETVLVCALLLLLFFDEWKWRKRFLTFAGVLLFYVLAKRCLTANLHIKVASFSMDNAKSIGDLLRPRILIENLKFISTPTLNNVFFASAGTIIGVLVLGWQRRFLPYMLVILAFLVCQSMWGAFNEFRIFMQILPLCVIILAERWQDYTYSATAWQPQTLAKPASKIIGPKNEPPKLIPSVLPWRVRETFPILTWLAILLCGMSVAISGWQYYLIIENRKPDHQARVVEALKSKAEKGDSQAQFQLAKHYLSGEGVTLNQTNAFQWFLRAAEQGIPEAECQLGLRYVQGEGTAKDFSASIPWFRRAATQGNEDSQYNLGLLYENGLGVKQDLAEAAIWYQRAGEKGNILAQNNLGLICFNFRKDYAEAAQWFHKAADQGNALAQNSLGVLYLNGLGVKQDANEALKWFQLAGQQGQVEGQKNCGLVFMSAQRFNEAAQWFHKAADQGNPQAQFNLAQFYQRGLPYPQDLAEANLWYSRSAKQGYGPAQLALGKIYHEGQGVKADNPEAYKWFKLAQLQGLPDAQNELTNCAAAMSKEQVNAAEEEVRKLQNGHQ